MCKGSKNPELTNARQKKTLAKMLTPKAPNDMRPDEVKSLLRHMEYDVEPGKGSAWIISKNGRSINIHKPHHPNKPNQMKPGAIRDIRNFMRDLEDVP